MASRSRWRKLKSCPRRRKLDAPDATASVGQTPAPPAASAAQVETTNGVKVTRGTGGPPKPLIIDVAQALGVKLAPAPDHRVLDKSRNMAFCLASRSMEHAALNRH